MVEMAINSTSFLKQERTLQGFAAGLISAACEWFLIFLLLIDAVFSYLLTQFSIYCELQLPCILCSRLDHVLGNQKPGFYRNLFCTNHKSEISSLVSCGIHGKLADVHGMCESCLLSSVKKSKLNSGMHKLHPGKMGFSLGSYEPYSFESSFYKMNRTSSRTPRLCLCCNELWTPKQSIQSSLQLKSSASEATKPNIPLPRRLSRRSSLKKKRDKMSSRGSNHSVGKKSFDPLSHVGYAELKINSEPESEFPFTDDDDLSSVIPDFSDKEESLAHYFATGIPPKRVDKMMLHNTNKIPEIKRFVHDDALEKGLSKIKPRQTILQTNNSELGELISLDDIPSSSNNVQVPIHVSSLSHNSCNPALFDVLSLAGTSPTITSKQVSQSSGKPSADVNETDQAVTNPAGTDSTCGDPSEMRKQTINDQERDEFEQVAERPKIKQDQTDGDTISIQGKNSLDQEIHSSQNSSSQAFQIQSNEPHKIDKAYSDELQNIYGSVSPDRTESGFESFDVSSVSEVEGESVVDRLRRQVEYDRKCMKVLHKELEEERSAAAVAANQALAMIAKLQEEKAALQMEAHQYLRMMEEQSEHDAEELEKANDLLAEKEKEIQDLEAELDYYRINFGDDPAMEELTAKRNDLDGNVSAENASVSCKEDDSNVHGAVVETIQVRNNDLKEEKAHKEKSVSFKKDDSYVFSKPMIADTSVDSDKPVVISLRSEIEDEKSNILQRLKSLEKKFHEVAESSSSTCISDNEDCIEAVEKRHQKQECTDENGEVRHLVQNGSPREIDIQVPDSKATTSFEEKLNTFTGGDIVNNNGSDHLVSSYGEEHGHESITFDLVAVENEILELNNRFEALEYKYNFLQSSSNSLQNENDERKFVYEMDLQLQKLRKLLSMRRC